MKKVYLAVAAGMLVLTGCGDAHIHHANHVGESGSGPETKPSECFVVETYDENFWATEQRNYTSGLYCLKEIP